jgi:hypothetical protein
VTQYVVIMVSAIPAVGTSVTATVHRAEAVDAAAAVEAAASRETVASMKAWAVPVASAAQFAINVGRAQNVVPE